MRRKFRVHKELHEQFALFARYFGLLLWPTVLSADYSFNQIPVSTGIDIHDAAGFAAAALPAPRQPLPLAMQATERPLPLRRAAPMAARRR